MKTARLAILVFVTLLAPVQAFAWSRHFQGGTILTVCNEGKLPFSVAFTYHRMNMPATHLNSKGWYNIVPGSCEQIYDGFFDYGYVGLVHQRRDGKPLASMLEPTEGRGRHTSAVAKNFCVSYPHSFDNAGTEADLTNCDGRSGYYLMPFSIRYDAPDYDVDQKLGLSVSEPDGVPFKTVVPTLSRSVPSGHLRAGELKRSRVAPFMDAIYDLFNDMRATGTKYKHNYPSPYGDMVHSIGDVQVLSCIYAVPSPDMVSRTFYYWNGNIPTTFNSALRAKLPKEHPIFQIGAPRTVCPDRNPELE